MLLVAGSKGLIRVSESGERDSEHFAGGKFMALAVSGRRAAVSLYKAGVHLSEDSGRTWNDISEGIKHKDVRALAFDPHHEGVLYAGTEPASVNRYEAGSWRTLGDLLSLPQAKDWSFPVPPKIPHVRSITPCPEAPGRLYALIEVGSLLLSEDGGESWNVLEGLGHDLHRLIVHPRRHRDLVVATGLDTGVYRGGYGIYRSADAGATWTQAVQGLTHRLYTEDAIAFWPDDPNVILLAAADGIPPKWASLKGLTLGVLSGNVYFLNPSKIRRRKGADIAIYQSKDAGHSWALVPDSTQIGLFDMVWALESGVSESGDPAVWFGTTGGEVRMTQDKGETWRVVSTDLGAITHLGPLLPE